MSGPGTSGTGMSGLDAALIGTLYRAACLAELDALSEQLAQNYGGARMDDIDLEALARRECDSREAIQIIASGRRVLGDQENVEPTEGPFSRT